MSICLSPEQRSEEFPITRTKVFLAHAAISPFSRRVCQAVQQYCQSNSDFGQWEYIWGPVEEKTRSLAGALVGCNADEIAFVSSTSMGLSLVAGGLPWQDGDNVVVADGDFPANVYPWLNLGRIGVTTKFIPRRPNGAVYVEDVMQAVDSRTRLVSLSSVNFVTGFRLDLDAIGAYLQEEGILFCVDAIQSLGALPFSARYVDFAVASSHKWQMGPMGVGLLFVRRKHFGRLSPVICGWKSVTDNHRYLDYHLEFADSAKRYEPGAINGMGIVGLHAALSTLIEAGIENIEVHLGRLRRQSADGLNHMGFEVLSPVDEYTGSGIVSFTSNSEEMTALRKYLDERNFVVSIRDSLDGRKCIRVAPHFYNTEEDIDAFLGAVGSFSGSNQRVFLPH